MSDLFAYFKPTSESIAKSKPKAKETPSTPKIEEKPIIEQPPAPIKQPEVESKPKKASAKASEAKSSETKASATKPKKAPAKPKKAAAGAKVILPELPPPSDNFTYAKGKFGHPDNPPNAGLKKTPIGAPGCLQGLTFCATGTLDSLTKDDFQNLIEQYGGRVTKAISGKTDLLVRGVIDVGQKKQDDASTKGIPIIDEDGLFFILKHSAPELNPVEEEMEELEPDVEDVQTEEPKTEEKTSQPSEEVLETEKTEEPEVQSQDIKSGGTNGLIFGSKPKKIAQDLISEKYRPTSVKDLVGNTQQIEQMKNWISTYQTQDKKALLISGPPGIGKSTSAAIIAREAGYHIVEYNASDTRNKEAVEQIAKNITGNHSLYRYHNANMTQKTALIFDEVDGMSSGDRGGIQALTALIQKSKLPIICICNDRDHQKIQTLAKACKDIRFVPPSQLEVSQRIKIVADAEGIKLNRQSMFPIITKSQGDLRTALNMLQLWRDQASTASEKDKFEANINEALEQTLMNKSKDLSQKLDLFFVDYDSAPDYMFQNLPYNSDHLKRADAYDALAIGDILHNSIRAEGSWDLLPTLGLFSWLIPSFLCPSNKVFMVRFPLQWSKLKTISKNKSIMTNAAAKASRTGGLTVTTFRESIADLVVTKAFTLLEEGHEPQLIDLLDELEISKDDLMEIKEIVDFKLDLLPKVSPQAKARFTKIYDSKHTTSKKADQDSLIESRADFLIRSGNLSGKKQKAKK